MPIRLVALALMLFVSAASAQEAEEGSEDVQQPGTGTIVRLGTDAKGLHVLVMGQEIEIFPAFEDYAYTLYDACEAMGLKVGKGPCDVFPMNGAIKRNAMATEIDAGRVDHVLQQAIIYDRELSQDFGYEGAQGVIAHELGHIYCGHLHRKEIDPSVELEADRFAGATMRKLKYPEDLATSMAAVFDERPSETHPAKSDRVKAIKAGWSDPESAFLCVKRASAAELRRSIKLARP